MVSQFSDQKVPSPCRRHHDLSTSTHPSACLSPCRRRPSDKMFANAGFRHALREAAPNLSRRYFSCQVHSLASSSRHSISSNARRLFHKEFKYARTQLSLASMPCKRGFRTSARLREAITQAETAVKKSSFPDTSSNTVAYWLLASAASVFGIVVFGGLTRLTESG